MNLEMGILFVKYVIMQKMLMFLQYILKEPTDSSIRKVFDVLKEYSRQEDFIHMINRQELIITHTDEETKDMSKLS